MDEPAYISYNRQVGQSVYLFWLVEASDLGTLMGFICLNMMIIESYWLFMWTFIFYVIFLCAFRAGRPRGYDRHFFAEFSAKSYLRPGRTDCHFYIREKNAKP